MALPILPLVLLGVGVLALRRRRRRASEKADDPGPSRETVTTVVFVPPQTGGAPEGPSGQPGQPCDASDGEGAWDDLGHCKTFWIDGATDEAIAALAIEEWEARGQPQFSDLCLAVADPLGGELAAPVDNPLLVEIVAASLQRYYEVGPVFPPTDASQGHESTSPYWVHKAWAKAHAVIRRELCGA